MFPERFWENKKSFVKKNAEQSHNIIILKKATKINFYQNLQLQTL